MGIEASEKIRLLWEIYNEENREVVQRLFVLRQYVYDRIFLFWQG